MPQVASPESIRLPFACSTCGHQEGLLADVRCMEPEYGQAWMVTECDHCDSPLATYLFEQRLRAMHGVT